MGKRRYNSADDLAWKRVESNLGDDIDLDDGLFYGLEEIDDVQVINSEGKISYEVLDRSKDAEESEIGNEAQSKEQIPKKLKIKETKQQKKRKQAKSEEVAASSDQEDDPEIFHASDDVTRAALFSVADSLGAWPELDPKILGALNSLGFTDPTEIQAKVIPLALENKDIIGKAATGSGKTLAFGLPLIQRSLVAQANGESPLQGFIISPTRELAHQIKTHLDAVMNVCCPETKAANVVCITGGLAIQKQTRLLSLNPKIIVGTPGRLLEVLRQMSPESLERVQSVKSLVLDEADRVVQAKNFQECEQILDIIGRKKERQVLVFSATFETDLWANLSRSKSAKSQDIREMLRKNLYMKRDAEFIDVKKSTGISETVTEGIIECPGMSKDLYLYYFMQRYPGKSIVFVNSIDSVKRLVPLLKELQLPVFGIHSDMIQKQRLRSLERFTAAANGILIATDVAARGLDIPAVDHVAHYHLPRSADTYVHRSGRTGRAGSEGVSVMLASPEEASGPLIKLCKLLKSKPTALDIDFKLLEQLRPRVVLAKEIADSVSGGTKQGKLTSWIDKAAEDLGIDLDDDERANLEMNSGKGKSNLKDTKVLRNQLHELLAKSLSSGTKYVTLGVNSLAAATFHNPLTRKGSEANKALRELQTRKKPKHKR